MVTDPKWQRLIAGVDHTDDMLDDSLFEYIDLADLDEDDDEEDDDDDELDDWAFEDWDSDVVGVWEEDEDEGEYEARSV